MEITQVRVYPVDEDKLRAFVSIVIDECFVVSDIKIIEGENGLFISMPSKKRKNGTFRDIAHPLNNETRQQLEERIVGEYREVMGDDGHADPTPVRTLGEKAARTEPRTPSEASPASAASPAGAADEPGPEVEDGRTSWP